MLCASVPDEVIFHLVFPWLSIVDLNRLMCVRRELHALVHDYVQSNFCTQFVPRLFAVGPFFKPPPFRVRAALGRHMREQQSAVVPHLVYDHGGADSSVRILTKVHADAGNDLVGVQLWPPPPQPQPEIPLTYPVKLDVGLGRPALRWFPQFDHAVRRVLGDSAPHPDEPVQRKRRRSCSNSNQPARKRPRRDVVELGGEEEEDERAQTARLTGPTRIMIDLTGQRR